MHFLRRRAKQIGFRVLSLANLASERLPGQVFAIAIVIGAVLSPNAVFAEPADKQVVKVINNEVAPYIYREKGEFKGVYFEQLEKLFKQANLDFELQLMPWPRVYRILLQEPDTLVVSIGRTPKRENLFNWVGELSGESTDMFYYKLSKRNIDLDKLTPAGPYVIGVLRDTYYEDFIEQKQFDKSYYYAVLKADDLIQMMLKERVDLVLFSEEHILQLAKDHRVDITKFEKAGFAFSVSHYMAFSKNTSQPLVEKLRKAFSEINN